MSKPEFATLSIGDENLEMPISEGVEAERAIDISKLRSTTGHITLDPGFGNTGSCESAITFIDGEKGILRYRGIPIEVLAAQSSFVETALLLIYGELPTEAELTHFSALLSEHQRLHERVLQSFSTFPSTAHPMAVLSSVINSVSFHHPDILKMENEGSFEGAAARLMSKVRTIAAASYRSSIGAPIIYPRPDLNYTENFLHMMFSMPYSDHELDPDIVDALRMFLILHADHEQNCSTSAVRTVASSGANLFASCSAGVCALWGPLHGGANVAVLNMLQEIHDNGIEYKDYMERVKNREFRLMGFGHRVYKSFDPRAKILRASAATILGKLGINDPLLSIARGLEEVALEDSFFVERDLYPNVDFYSGIIMRALGIPTDMFTVMFAIGRMPGWISQWKEQADSAGRIIRPRQVYTGPAKRAYTPISERK